MATPPPPFFKKIFLKFVPALPRKSAQNPNLTSHGVLGVGCLLIDCYTCYTERMTDTAEEPLEGNVEPDLRAQVAEWEGKLVALSQEKHQTQIRLPKELSGRRVNREEIANAFLTSFELVGGVPRLALWADSNYTEFVKIFGRLLPKEVLTVHDGEVVVKHAVPPSPLDSEDGT